MDINSYEAKVLGHRIAEGRMMRVPEGIRDVERRQTYGATTHKRVYRYDEQTQSFNILTRNRDRFEMVVGLNPGEAIVADGSFSNMTLLPDKTFYENCKEQYVPAVLRTSLSSFFGTVLLGTVAYVIWHPRAIMDGILHVCGRNGPVPASLQTVHIMDPYPSETGWPNPLERIAKPAAPRPNLAGALAAGSAMAVGAGIAAHTNKLSQQKAQSGQLQD